ncbi:predicted protein [Plenodomus lingam JN3]|uniref:Predicted protein n=1 Tax=Leptosphaeria maculans (strain JN3 / isolate v23.1.3 / race Av1-4-5-6-7-8) TaxID=985895 RepID=E4ZS13_LEPMJ|nr:predicted protein [Plenodomus lingam JN3]CBX94193.1 predicted protein [Plenodomus lingam JN3]
MITAANTHRRAEATRYTGYVVVHLSCANFSSRTQNGREAIRYQRRNRNVPRKPDLVSRNPERKVRMNARMNAKDKGYKEKEKEKLYYDYAYNYSYDYD